MTHDSPLDADEFEERYRHCLGRNLETFESAFDGILPLLGGEPLPVDLFHGLQVLCAADYGIHRPGDRRLPDIHDTVLVLVHRGCTYLVNTEGDNCCRFVVPCILIRS